MPPATWVLSEALTPSDFQNGAQLGQLKAGLSSEEETPPLPLVLLGDAWCGF